MDTLAELLQAHLPGYDGDCGDWFGCACGQVTYESESALGRVSWIEGPDPEGPYQQEIDWSEHVAEVIREWLAHQE